MASEDIRNAKIDSTMLGFEDHGIMTFWLTLNYGASAQGFGGFNLSYKGANIFNLIGSLLRTVGVESWERLPGQIVQARIEDGRVVAIGHALNGTWFDPVKLLDSDMAAEDDQECWPEGEPAE